MAAAGSADATGTDLALLGDVAAEFADVLVVDLVDLRLAEEARLPPPASQGRETLATPPIALFLGHSCSSLEGDVVVRRSTEVGVGSGNRGRHELIGLAARAVASTEELDAVRDDLDRLSLGAVLCFPLAPLEASVDA